jgi:CBS domain-containing protein
VYDYVPGKAAWLAMDLPFEGDKGPDTRAGAVADRATAACGLHDKVADIADRGGVCVVVADGLVLGVLDTEALADRTRTAEEGMSPGPSTFRPSLPQDELATYLDEHDLDHTLITTLDGRLVGVVRREDLDS